jgi:hypothetical protein
MVLALLVEPLELPAGEPALGLGGRRGGETASATGSPSDRKIATAASRRPPFWPAPNAKKSLGLATRSPVYLRGASHVA